MREADFQSIFTKWAKKNFYKSAAFELKICKLKSLAFSRVEEHQVASLYKAKHTTLFHKISDMSLGFKPFDCFTLSGAEAYVVIMFYKPKDRQYCYMVDIDEWIEYQVASKRKSITEDECASIGQKVDLINTDGG